MIARIWRGYTKNAEDADAYEAMLKPELLPGLHAVKGYVSSSLLRRELGDGQVEFITIIIWDSIDSIRAIAGEDYEVAVIPAERRKYLTRFDTNAQHFEVVSANPELIAAKFA